MCDVAEALVKKYPCLKEPGSFSGYYGWQQSLKYKMANYRTKLCGYGVPEVMCNALKRKSPADQKSAKNVKKPRKAEVNYLPPYPAGEDEESQEQERIQLLTEVRKRDNNKLIKEKMAKTFAHRRNEIVKQSPTIEDIKARWPALFEASNVSYKCIVIRDIPLQLWGVNYLIQNISYCHLINHVFRYFQDQIWFIVYIICPSDPGWVSQNHNGAPGIKDHVQAGWILSQASEPLPLKGRDHGIEVADYPTEGILSLAILCFLFILNLQEEMLACDCL